MVLANPNHVWLKVFAESEMRAWSSGLSFTQYALRLPGQALEACRRVNCSRNLVLIFADSQMTVGICANTSTECSDMHRKNIQTHTHTLEHIKHQHHFILWLHRTLSSRSKRESCSCCSVEAASVRGRPPSRSRSTLWMRA